MTLWHMSGAGNDFMVMDARGIHPDFVALSQDFCARTGADGFMALDHSNIADFKLHFYNSDGSRGEMCGNGARCICRFAYDQGLVGESMVVETDAGLVPGIRLAEDRYRVQLHNPSVLDLDRIPGVCYVEEGDPGIPHAVMEVPDLTWDKKEQLRETALHLLNHPAFPKGVNVNFYAPLSDSTIRVLTFERGVDDYTLACGTGCAAIACALWAQGKLPGETLTLRNQGGDLTVTVKSSGDAVTSLLLEGPAEILKIYENL